MNNKEFIKQQVEKYSEYFRNGESNYCEQALQQTYDHAYREGIETVRKFKTDKDNFPYSVEEACNKAEKLLNTNK